MRPFPGNRQALGSAGFAEYGYCASHSRYFWGLRLHLLCTLHGLPIAAAVTGAKADERQVLLGMLDDADLTGQIPGTTLIADKNYYGREFETSLAVAGITLLRPTRKGETTRPGEQFFKPLRQTIESVFDTFKGQLDLEMHGGRPQLESWPGSGNASLHSQQWPGTTRG